MDTTVNNIIMAAAILIAMVFVAYVALKQSDRNICTDITSLTEATASDIAMALKYASFASSNQVVKNFNFPDRFQIDLTKDDLTVKYTGPCPDKGEHTIEHNVKRIKEVIVEDSKNKKRTALCIKKYFENCEPFVTICLTSDADCCVVEPSDCGGYSDGVSFLDTYINPIPWSGTQANTDAGYMVEKYDCEDGEYYIVNKQIGSDTADLGSGIWLEVFKTGEVNSVYEGILYAGAVEKIDDAISVKIKEYNVLGDESDWFVNGEVVCGTY